MDKPRLCFLLTKEDGQKNRLAGIYGSDYLGRTHVLDRAKSRIQSPHALEATVGSVKLCSDFGGEIISAAEQKNPQPSIRVSFRLQSAEKIASRHAFFDCDP